VVALYSTKNPRLTGNRGFWRNLFSLSEFLFRDRQATASALPHDLLVMRSQHFGGNINHRFHVSDARNKSCQRGFVKGRFVAEFARKDWQKLTIFPIMGKLVHG
jgi:hypothetical protein